jgi:hypothetical protein
LPEKVAVGATLAVACAEGHGYPSSSSSAVILKENHRIEVVGSNRMIALISSMPA